MYLFVYCTVFHVLILYFCVIPCGRWCGCICNKLLHVTPPGSRQILKICGSANYARNSFCIEEFNWIDNNVVHCSSVNTPIRGEQACQNLLFAAHWVVVGLCAMFSLPVCPLCTSFFWTVDQGLGGLFMNPVPGIRNYITIFVIGHHVPCTGYRVGLWPFSLTALFQIRDCILFC